MMFKMFGTIGKMQTNTFKHLAIYIRDGLYAILFCLPIFFAFILLHSLCFVSSYIILCAIY